MAFWCIDPFRAVFYSLLVTFASCHSGLPCDAAALAARDRSDDSHNWNKVIQTLASVDSRIGIPWAALLNLPLNMPLNAEMAPYDLTIVPNGASGSPENEPIVVDERPPMVLAARRGAKSIQRSERQERRLKSILEDMRAQGVKLALPKSLLDRAPLRLRNDDTKLATQVEEPQVGDRFTNSGTKTSLILGGSSESNPVEKENMPSKTGDQSRPFLAAASKKKEAFGVHRTPSQPSPSKNQDNGSNTANPSLPETPSESQGLPSSAIRYTNGSEASP